VARISPVIARVHSADGRRCPISHLAGDRRARFDAPPSMELIKRGRAICSRARHSGPPRVTGRGGTHERGALAARQYRKVREPDPAMNSRGQGGVGRRDGVHSGVRNPRGDDGYDSVSVLLHDLISLRLTPRAIPSVTLSLSMRAPCGALITHDERRSFLLPRSIPLLPSPSETPVPCRPRTCRHRLHPPKRPFIARDRRAAAQRGV